MAPSSGKSVVDLLREAAEEGGFGYTEDAPLDLTTKIGQKRYLAELFRKGDLSNRDKLDALRHLAEISGLKSAGGDLRREEDEAVVSELLSLSPIVEQVWRIRFTDKGPVQKPRRGRPPKIRVAEPEAPTQHRWAKNYERPPTPRGAHEPTLEEEDPLAEEPPADLVDPPEVE